LLVTYFVTVIIFSFSHALEAKKLNLLFAAIVSYLVLHISYGVGSLLGLFSLLSGEKK